MNRGMKRCPLPPADYLKARLSYNASTGEVRWRPRPLTGDPWLDSYVRRWNARYSERVAGYMAGDYRQVVIDYRKYQEHRVIWKMVTGEEPPIELDHKDRRKTHNVISNMRPATHAENGRNHGIRKNNTSGVKGVYYIPSSGRWRAMIMVDRKCIHLGMFDTCEEAAMHRKQASERYYGSFA